MGRVDTDGRQEWVNLALKVALREGAGLFVHLLPLQQADALLAQFGQKLLIPAAILGVHKAMNLGG